MAWRGWFEGDSQGFVCSRLRRDRDHGSRWRVAGRQSLGLSGQHCLPGIVIAVRRSQVLTSRSRSRCSAGSRGRRYCPAAQLHLLSRFDVAVHLYPAPRLYVVLRSRWPEAPTIQMCSMMLSRHHTRNKAFERWQRQWDSSMKDLQMYRPVRISDINLSLPLTSVRCKAKHSKANQTKPNQKEEDEIATGHSRGVRRTCLLDVRGLGCGT